MHLAFGKVHLLGAAAVELRDQRGQARAHLARGVLRGAAVEVGAARCGRGARVGHLGSVAGRDLHLGQRHAELVGDDLRHLGVQPLPHFGAAVVDLHAAVGIDMHQRAGLVELRGREADAKLDRRERKPAAQHGLCAVPGQNGLLPAPVVGRQLQF